jgi:hypothetical protein
MLQRQKRKDIGPTKRRKLRIRKFYSNTVGSPTTEFA